MPGLHQLRTTVETAAGDWRADDRVMTTIRVIFPFSISQNALPSNYSL
jgi:hypothetical protein